MKLLIATVHVELQVMRRSCNISLSSHAWALALPARKFNYSVNKLYGQYTPRFPFVTRGLIFFMIIKPTAETEYNSKEQYDNPTLEFTRMFF